MSLGSLRQQIADAIDGVAGLKAYAYPAGDIVTPAAVIEPDEVDLRQRGLEPWEFSIYVLVSAADAQEASRRLDELFDRLTEENNLERLIEQALGSAAAVVGAEGWGAYRYGAVDYPGVRFRLEVK